MDSFVFYDSFIDTADCFEEDAADFIYHAARCLLGRESIENLPRSYAAAITQMRASVISAKERYEKAKDDGTKGGRPKKYIPPEEWQAYYETHSRKETAEHFGIPEETLKKWITTMGKKGKNLNVNVNDNANVNVNDNDNDNDISNIYINNNSRSRRGASEAPSLPALKEGERWVTEPYLSADGGYMADYETASGEVRSRPLE